MKFDMTDPALVGLYSDTGDRGPAIELVTGERLHILNPERDVIEPTTIAHALSQLCRFTGHTRTFYSVAQHCVMVSRIVPEDLAMEGLLHDASEAFVGDLSRPLKAVINAMAPGLFVGIEDGIHAAIAEVFGTGFPHDPAIKEADNIALATEKRDLMFNTGETWHNLPEPLSERIHALEPIYAYEVWLDRFAEIGGTIG